MLIPLLFISYPLLVHLSIFLNQPLLQGLALCSLCLGIMKLTKAKGLTQLLFIAAMATSLALTYFHASIFILYLPPIIIPMFVLIGFGGSLLKGREPLVTAIGEASRGPLSQEMRHYTLRVTQLWTVILTLVTLINLSLAISGNQLLWSWVTSIGNYLFIGLVFISEFIYRKIRFKDHDHPSFIEYIKIVTTTNVDTKQKPSKSSSH